MIFVSKITVTQILKYEDAFMYLTLQDITLIASSLTKGYSLSLLLFPILNKNLKEKPISTI